jgi:hypothetical protein
MTSGDTLNFSVGSGGTLNSASTGALRSWLLPDNSGTIALTSDIPSTPTLAQVLVAGNSTSGTNIILTSGDTINYSVGSGGTLNSASTTALRSWLLPDNSGTIALTSDIPAPAAITLNVIPKGTGTTITDGSWQFATNDIIPTTTGSNIGDATHRIGTIFMASVFDYANNLTFYNGASTTMTLTTGGSLGIGITPTNPLHVYRTINDFLYEVQVQNPNAGASAASAILIQSDTGKLEFGQLSSTHTTYSGYGQLSDTFIRSGVGARNLNVITDPSNTGKILFWSRLNPTIDAATPSLAIDGQRVGFGLNTPTATAHIQGVDSTSSNYALKIQNSSTSNIALFRNDGIVNIGNATETNQRLVRIGQGTATIDIGSLPTSTTVGAIYLSTSAIPSDSNYNFAGLGIQTFINAGTTSGSIVFRVAGVNTVATYQQGNIAFTPASTTGVTSNFKVTSSANTNAGSGTEAIGVEFDMSNNVAHASNTLVALQRDFLIRRRTHSFGSLGGVITNIATAVVNGAASGGLNSTLINSSGLLVETSVVANVTNSYGATINAQTGATNNYTARFLGGNTGFGISSPTSVIHAFGVDATTLSVQTLEPVSNVTEVTTGATVNTTTNANTTLETIAVPADTILMIESYVTCRKTGGAGVGTTGEGNGYVRTVKAQNIGGVVTIGAVQTSFTSESIGAFNATFVVSGTNIILQVTGANNDNVTWNSITKKYKVA